LKLDRWHHADFAVEAPVVEPAGELDRRDFGVFDAAPGAAVADEPGFEDRVHRLRESVVVTVALRPDRRDGLSFGKAFGVADGSILDTAVAVTDQRRQVAVLALYIQMPISRV
jgi:hypothetical protein